jgi:hypothetical protein
MTRRIPYFYQGLMSYGYEALLPLIALSSTSLDWISISPMSRDPCCGQKLVETKCSVALKVGRLMRNTGR